MRSAALEVSARRSLALPVPVAARGFSPRFSVGREGCSPRRAEVFGFRLAIRTCGGRFSGAPRLRFKARAVGVFCFTVLSATLTNAGFTR